MAIRCMQLRQYVFDVMTVWRRDVSDLAFGPADGCFEIPREQVTPVTKSRRSGHEFHAVTKSRRQKLVAIGTNYGKITLNWS